MKINVWQELLATFSSKESFFSSKRIERFATFVIMLGSTTAWLAENIYKSKLSAGDLMIVVGGWLAYAGFNVIQGQKDSNNSPKPE